MLLTRTCTMLVTALAFLLFVSVAQADEDAVGVVHSAPVTVPVTAAWQPSLAPTYATVQGAPGSMSPRPASTNAYKNALRVTSHIYDNSNHLVSTSQPPATLSHSYDGISKPAANATTHEDTPRYSADLHRACGPPLYDVASECSVAAKSGPDLDAMARAAAAPGKGGQLTRAGHALDKHGSGQRGAPSPLPTPKGTDAAKNAMGQHQVDDILTHPDAVFTPLGRGGMEVRLPDGRAMRYDADGRFAGFVD